MKSLAPAALLAASLALVASPALAEEKASPEFDRIKALAGEWEGSARGDGMKDAMPTKATVRVVSAGSAVMLVTDPGTPHEMVTMFHRDDGALVATHYCAAMNQPRLKAKPSKEPDRIAFEFVDGTNLGAHPGHMHGLVLGTPDAERHTEEWTFREGEKTSTVRMELKRKR